MSGICGIVDWDSQRIASEALLPPEPGEHWIGKSSVLKIPGVGQVCLTGNDSNRAEVQMDPHYLFCLGAGGLGGRETVPGLSNFSKVPADRLRALNGDFVACLIDSAKKELLLAVDLFSSIPIYFSRVNGAVLFSTDLHALAQHPSLSRKISKQSIYDYLYFTIIPAPSTIFENIFRIPAGCFVRFDREGNHTESWYRPQPERSYTDSRYRALLSDALSDAVSDQWAGESKSSACFLSGGLDSSTVCGLSASANSRPVTAFSIGFPDDDFDETSYARLASDTFELDHRIHYVNAEEITANISRFVTAFGEPFSNASTITAYLCAQQAKSAGFDRLLAGDGGDELFAGNERYKKQLTLHHFDKLPSVIQRGMTAMHPERWNLPTAFLRRAGSYVRQASLPFARRSLYNNFIELEGYANVFSSQFLSDVDANRPVELLQSLFDSAPFDSYLKRMLYVDWQITLADNDLRKVRIGCQLAGVDVCFPMLDRRVVEIAETIPGKLLMPRGKLRGFYKDSFQHLLPAEIINKPKHGFGVPVGRWMQSDPALAELVSSKLKALAQRDIFLPSFLARLQKAHSDDNADHYGVVLWTLMTLEMWLESNTG